MRRRSIPRIAVDTLPSRIWIRIEYGQIAESIGLIMARNVGDVQANYRGFIIEPNTVY